VGRRALRRRQRPADADAAPPGALTSRERRGAPAAPFSLQRSRATSRVASRMLT
jgi:hypothetical protein